MRTLAASSPTLTSTFPPGGFTAQGRCPTLWPCRQRSRQSAREERGEGRRRPPRDESEEEGGEEAEREAENKAAFGKLTDAAAELMDMGFEDIYVQTREQILETVEECAPILPRPSSLKCQGSNGLGTLSRG